MRSAVFALLSLCSVVGCAGSTKDPVARGDGGAGAGGSAPTGTTAGSSGTPPDGAGGGEAFVDCDAKKVTCRRAPPTCGTFEVPRVDDACYGECVKIDRCACNGPDQCPDSNQYTCWAKTHCGPYVH